MSADDEAHRSYSRILAATAVLGGSAVIGAALSIIRNKAIALMLGPEGIGLIGLCNSILELSQAVVGGGVQGAGVREIAEATNDEDQLRRKAGALRLLSLTLGLVGALALAVFATPIARLTFDDPAQRIAVMILAVAVLFRMISAGHAALMQGVQRTGDLARFTIWSAAVSTAASIPLAFLFGPEGIAPALAIGCMAATLISWRQTRDIAAPEKTDRREWRREIKDAFALARIGLVFAASGVLMIGAAYLIRVIVTHDAGVAAAGLYHAAWALASLYAGFILQAMGADFYPRLSKVASDNLQVNRLVNEQTEISVLMAGPGLLATLTLAPMVMTLFYTAEFQGAVDVLRWICLGMMLRIIAWPMGFIVLAKNAWRTFFWTEIAAALIYVGLAWRLTPLVGVSGAGMAFFGLYLWHGLLIYVLVRKLTGFRWSKENLRLGLIFLPATAIAFAALMILPPLAATLLGLLLTATTGLYALKRLLAFAPVARFPFKRVATEHGHDAL